jgi:hypothetical protein
MGAFGSGGACTDTRLVCPTGVDWPNCGKCTAGIPGDKSACGNCAYPKPPGTFPHGDDATIPGSICTKCSDLCVPWKGTPPGCTGANTILGATGCNMCRGVKTRLLTDPEDSGKCVAGNNECPQGYFGSRPSDIWAEKAYWVCLPCSSECKTQPAGGPVTCDGPSPSECHECKNAKDANGVCVSQCPSMHFWSGTACQACDQVCAPSGCTAAGPQHCVNCAKYFDGACIGSSSSACRDSCVNECPAGKVLGRPGHFGTNRCIVADKCGTDQFKDGTNIYIIFSVVWREICTLRNEKVIH